MQILPIEFAPKHVQSLTNKSKFILHLIDSGSMTIPESAGRWDEGSRSAFHKVPFEVRVSYPLTPGDLVEFNGYTDMVLEVGDFQGGPMIPVVYISRDDVDKFAGFERRDGIPTGPYLADWLADQGRHEEASRLFRMMGNEPDPNEVKGFTERLGGKWVFKTLDGEIFQVKQAGAQYMTNSWEGSVPHKAIKSIRKGIAWVSIKN